MGFLLPPSILPFLCKGRKEERERGAGLNRMNLVNAYLTNMNKIDHNESSVSNARHMSSNILITINIIIAITVDMSTNIVCCYEESYECEYQYEHG